MENSLRDERRVVIADLTPQQRDKITALHYDCIIEKHEGPRSWRGEFEYSNLEFLLFENHCVLLPIDVEHHANLSLVRCLESKDGEALTLFLKDTTFIENAADEFLQAGFLAVCDRVENFFVATVYHEWFLVPRGRILKAPAIEVV